MVYIILTIVFIREAKQLILAIDKLIVNVRKK